MKVVMESGVFGKGVSTLQSIITPRATLPILSNILIEASGDHLTLSGTDLEIAITTTIPAQVQEAGTTTIPAKRLNDLLKELPNQSLTLTVKKNHMTTIECGMSHFKLMGLPPEEFPKLPTLSDQHPLQLPQQTLQTMLDLTMFAMSRDETRYILNGVCFILKKGRLRLVATDGRRLALIERQFTTTHPEFHVVIPTKTIHELHRLLGADEMLRMAFSGTQAKFELGPTTIISRTIEGEFPDYEQVIPPEASMKVRLDREALLLAIRRASLWTTQESQSIKFDVAKNKLIVSKQTPELGEAREEVAAEYHGQELTIGFNPTYLTDVLKQLPDAAIDVELPSPERPGVIRTKDQYIYIVLPMQLT